ncbi:ATP-binding protein [Microbacterium paludicola]|uniref:ATP-binding protein n=1 Tax=Microbacterium paludicola TaxID=300019 RepID=A0A4Y9FU19_9MICO|nr:ATP-binding protein [Microbacterium paludicola]MBF0816486.1 PspC domain-containing protein [Microbacterium paludicola]TFU32795.1 ATP-binding protein [Microbacterium paludicola]
MTVLSSAVGARSGVPLVRPHDVVLSGVSTGVARHLGWPVGTVRALFIATTAVWGVGALLYLWLWALVPAEPAPTSATRRVPVAALLLGASALLLFLSIGRYHNGMGPAWVPPATLIPVYLGVGLALAAGIWSALVDRRDPARGARHDIAVRIVATALALAAVPLFLGAADNGRGNFQFMMLVSSLGAMVCAAAVWTPNLVARLRELQTARVKSIRDEHRAEMAAHLHDSVLQTLALIQNRAGASSEVGRLARAQERELRAWLYDGDTPADSDLATDLRDYGSALELDYEVVMTVVSAGTSTERASGEVAAAAREAMLNAARHAGGEVSVYIEGSPGSVDVYVRDRGPGFDPQEVPADRLGVRESIIGRLRRIGGSATVTPGAGDTGTQVHIRYPAGGARG